MLGLQTRNFEPKSLVDVQVTTSPVKRIVSSSIKSLVTLQAVEFGSRNGENLTALFEMKWIRPTWQIESEPKASPEGERHSLNWTTPPRFPSFKFIIEFHSMLRRRFRIGLIEKDPSNWLHDVVQISLLLCKFDQQLLQSQLPREVIAFLRGFRYSKNRLSSRATGMQR